MMQTVFIETQEPDFNTSIDFKLRRVNKHSVKTY